MVADDGLAWFFKLVILGTALLTCLVSIRSPEVFDAFRGEFFVLVVFAALGMVLMAGAANLLMLYLAMETASLSSYVLAGFLSGQSRSAEASFKYVIYGAVASGVMLFGLSLLFGIGGTLDLAELPAALAGASPLAVVLALLFVLAGLGYKLASVPFHMWSPDVYEGAPLPVTAFLSVASKAGAFALTLRFFDEAFGDRAIALATQWPLLLALISLLTMTIGNLAAIGQRNMKRLLAYSSIAHGGYLLMGVVALANPAVRAEAMAAVGFYFVAYLFMNLGAFYVVQHLAEPERLNSEMIADYAGLLRRSPFLAVALSIFLFSLIGIPPFAGFWAKLYLFEAFVRAGLEAEGIAGGRHLWLVVAALLNTAISLYYYLYVVKTMCFDSAVEDRPVRAHPAFVGLMLVLLIPTFVLGLLWSREELGVPVVQVEASASLSSSVSPTLGTPFRR
ncbi:MAG: hypothetical protein KatS3mg115_0285 [Candidatus Poribacteria bacterium]|nr:MAG: hypothetical protein KatS3mg115_0285 [Candidatus Poribacteria bacterium]